MPIIRRIGAGFLWFCGTYLVITFVGGLISDLLLRYILDTGDSPLARDEALERLAGGFAGEEFVEAYCERILMFAMLFSALGTSMGLLAGTGSAKEEDVPKYSVKQIKTITVSAWLILVVGSADVILGILTRKFPVFGVLCLCLGMYLLFFFLRKYAHKET